MFKHCFFFPGQQTDLHFPRRKAVLLRRVKSSEHTTQTYQSHTEIDGIYFVVAITITGPVIWLVQVGTDISWSL